MSDWVCYLIKSFDSNCTYIGSTNNMIKRLNAHNSTSPSRKGARRTRGQLWSPVVIISGFNGKIDCLSFEAGWKRLSKYRSNTKLFYINKMANLDLRYTKNTIWNRVLDLLYFMHNLTIHNAKFKLNYAQNYPFIVPNFLTLNIFLDNWINSLSWPYFVLLSNVNI